MNGADQPGGSGGVPLLLRLLLVFFQTFSPVGVVLDFDWYMSSLTVVHMQNCVNNAGVWMNS